MKTSIVMAAYNGARYIQKQLNSFLDQSVMPDELIVVDDFSSDQTGEILSRFKQKAPFAVHLIQNEENIGSTKSFEKGLKRSTGDIIFFSDQDDVWLRNKIELLLIEFGNNEPVDLLFSDATIVNEDLKSLDYTLWEHVGLTEKKQQLLQSPKAFEILNRQLMVTGTTMAIRKRLTSSLFPIPAEWVHDAWISLVAAATSRIKPVNKQLLLYRQHSSQQIGALEYQRKMLGWELLADLSRANFRKSEMLADVSKTLQRCTLFSERLEMLEFPDKKRALSLLHEKESWLKKRVSLSKQPRLFRLFPLAKGFLRGSYHACDWVGWGWRGFILDLLARP